MPYRIQAAFLACLAFCISCTSQQKETKKTAGDGLEAFIQNKGDSLVSSGSIPGLFVAILDNGKRSYYSYGYADRERKSRFDSATVFEIGSITKTFTAYVLEAVLLEKKISDTSFILPYLPDSVRKNKALAGISFLSLLNHTSGLPRLPNNLDLMTTLSPYDNYDERQLFSFLKTAKPETAGKSEYSNLGAGLAGWLASSIAGKSYERLLQELIFNPFRLPYFTDRAVAAMENRAKGYFEEGEAIYWRANVLGPAYQVKTSANDLLSYLDQIGNPESEQGKMLSSLLLEKTAGVQNEVNVCRSWHTLEKTRKNVIYWHNGGTYGFSCFGGFIKDKGKAVVVVVNQFNKNVVSDGLGFGILKRIDL